MNRTPDQWRAELAQILDRADVAASARDEAAMSALAEELGRFVLRSSPNTPEILALDELAIRARRELSRRLAEGPLARIEGRSVEFVALAKQLEAAGRSARAAARSGLAAVVGELADAAARATTAAAAIPRLAPDDPTLQRQAADLADAVDRLLRLVRSGGQPAD